MLNDYLLKIEYWNTYEHFQQTSTCVLHLEQDFFFFFLGIGNDVIQFDKPQFMFVCLRISRATSSSCTRKHTTHSSLTHTYTSDITQSHSANTFIHRCTQRIAYTKMYMKRRHQKISTRNMYHHATCQCIYAMQSFGFVLADGIIISLFIFFTFASLLFFQSLESNEFRQMKKK